MVQQEVVLIRSPCYHNSAVLKLRVPDEIPPGPVLLIEPWALRES